MENEPINYKKIVDEIAILLNKTDDKDYVYLITDILESNNYYKK